MQGSSVILSELSKITDFHNGYALRNTNHIFVYERLIIFLYEILENNKSFCCSCTDTQWSFSVVHMCVVMREGDP